MEGMTFRDNSRRFLSGHAELVILGQRKGMAFQKKESTEYKDAGVHHRMMGYLVRLAS